MKLIVLFWSDGSRNVFENTKNLDSFITWKRRNWPDLTYESKKMTREEYQNLIDNPPQP